MESNRAIGIYSSASFQGCGQHTGQADPVMRAFFSRALDAVCAQGLLCRGWQPAYFQNNQEPACQVAARRRASVGCGVAATPHGDAHRARQPAAACNVLRTG